MNCGRRLPRLNGPGHWQGVQQISENEFSAICWRRGTVDGPVLWSSGQAFETGNVRREVVVAQDLVDAFGF